VHVLACDKSKFVLTTSIQIAPTGDCVVWRLMSAVDGTVASALSVHNLKNGRITFQKHMRLAPTQFVLRVSPSSMWLKPGMMGTTLHALQSDHMGVSSLIHTSFQLHWQAVRLLFIAMMKPCAGPKNTRLTFAVLSHSLLQHIIGFANDPFGMAEAA